MPTINPKATNKITKWRIIINKSISNIKWDNETTQLIQKKAEKEGSKEKIGWIENNKIIDKIKPYQ